MFPVTLSLGVVLSPLVAFLQFLMVRVGGAIYPWSAAAPMVMGGLLFGCRQAGEMGWMKDNNMNLGEVLFVPGPYDHALCVPHALGHSRWEHLVEAGAPSWAPLPGYASQMMAALGSEGGGGEQQQPTGRPGAAAAAGGRKVRRNGVSLGQHGQIPSHT